MLGGLLDRSKGEDARRQREKENFLYNTLLANPLRQSTDEFTHQKQIQNRRSIWHDPERVARMLQSPRSGQEQRSPRAEGRASQTLDRIVIDGVSATSPRLSELGGSSGGSFTGTHEGAKTGKSNRSGTRRGSGIRLKWNRSGSAELVLAAPAGNNKSTSLLLDDRSAPGSLQSRSSHRSTSRPASGPKKQFLGSLLESNPEPSVPVVKPVKPYEQDLRERAQLDYEAEELSDDELDIPCDAIGCPREVIFAELARGSYFGALALA